MLERVTIDGCDLHYQTTGDGPPVVLLHGFSGNHLSWWQQIPSFAEEYRCVAPDQRGFGRSVDREDGPGVAAFPDDLAALLDHLGIDRVALVGHSMSGWTAASFATQHPDRVAAMVLSGTPGGLIPAERHRELMEAGAGGLPDVDPLTPERAFLEESIAALNDHGPAEWTDVRPTLDGLPLDPDVILDAGVPVFAIAGEADAFMPGPAVGALSERLDGCPYEVVEGAGHSSNFERPDAFNRRVRGFLDAEARF
jgi:pimeloyl-ACP methyl ester carboxylesterase